jgi:hypothetical protein
MARDLQDFTARYAEMNEEELMNLARSYDSLTDSAQTVLREEFKRRGLEPPFVEDVGESPAQRRLITIGRYRDLTEADIARSVLESAGIHTYMWNENLVRVDWPVSNAIGGVQLQVDADDELACCAVDATGPGFDLLHRRRAVYPTRLSKLRFKRYRIISVLWHSRANTSRKRRLALQCLPRVLGGNGGLAFALADQLRDRQRQGERPHRQAAHRDHQRQPAGVGVRTLAADASEYRLREQGCQHTRAEDGEAGAEKLARVSLHCGQRQAACITYTMTPVTET